MTDTNDIGSVFVSNYPPFSFWQPAAIETVEATLGAPPREGVNLGLYLHIPFCRKRCRFCYFRVYTEKNSAEVTRYLDALAKEVEGYAETAAIGGRPLDFVYFGGGTPSYLSVRQLQGLTKRLRAAMPWQLAREITFECEPGTLTESKVHALRELGVTRLSLGIENFDDAILRENGRAHISTEIHRVRPWIEAAQFPQVNVDLIAGMLGESWDTWKQTVEKTIEWNPDSVTIYQLELPWNATFSKELQEGQARSFADWDTKRAWNDWAIERLGEVGYELSSAYTMVRRRNGEKPRFVYRDSVWDGCDLLGTGVASFSHISGVHFQNLDRWETYLAAVEAGHRPIHRAFPTSMQERLTRELILQLKLGRLDLGHLDRKFGVDVAANWKGAFAELEQRGFLALNDNEVELTRKGLLRVDSLLPTFYDPRYRNARYT
jgi:oxygen-independent coproporphyrinogen-3 oxidase